MLYFMCCKLKIQIQHITVESDVSLYPDNKYLSSYGMQLQKSFGQNFSANIFKVPISLTRLQNVKIHKKFKMRYSVLFCVM